MSRWVNFNPRSQTGATKSPPGIVQGIDVFQSTLPNGSDLLRVQLIEYHDISIHAPKRERLQTLSKLDLSQYISIHAPKRERRNGMYVVKQIKIFQSTLPNGSDGKHAQYRIQKSCKVSNNYLYILHITPFICISKHQSRIFSYHLSVRISLTFHVHLPFAPYITTAPTIFQLKWHITLFCNCIKLEF